MPPDISEKKGTLKHKVTEIQLKLRRGIAGDIHKAAGSCVMPAEGIFAIVIAGDIHKAAGSCVMPAEGIFAIVIKGAASGRGALLKF